MTFTKGNLGFFLAFLIIGGILGSAIGTLIVKIFPSLSVITKSLTGPIGFSLEIIRFSLRLNLMSIIGIITGVFIFRKV